MLTPSNLAVGLSLLVGLLVAILTLGPISGPGLASVAHSDKLYHALAFATLALPIAVLRRDWLIIAIPVCAAFGGLIELIQPFVGRDRELMDWIADLIGIGFGSMLGIGAAAIANTIRGSKKKFRACLSIKAAE